jgi:HPt (histidine-containing phosphotransfer) domain-containing protein
MSMLALKEIHSPALAPGEDAIDLNHLSRMTLGERSLEREVLALFVRQADILLAKMNLANPAIAAAAAHTLKGSAVGIGAWPVARAAEAVEQAVDAELPDAIGSLSVAIEQAREAIAGLLRAH